MQLVDQARAFIDQVAAVLDQASELACQFGVRLECLELVAMEADKLLDQLGIGAIVLGAADREGRTVVFQGFGVEGPEHDEVVGQER